MHPEINEIRKKMTTAPWPKFLNYLTISGIRGWTGQTVRFPFPIVAIAGENGAGKTTILQAAASAYNHPRENWKSFFVGNFFPDTAWENIVNASIHYGITQGDVQSNYVLNKRSARWRGYNKRAGREVLMLDIGRTLPISRTVGYNILSRRSAQESTKQGIQLDPSSIRYMSSIIGKSYQSARRAFTNLDNSRPFGLLTQAGITYSNIHQGAGEDTMHDTLEAIQQLPNTSLLIIDEVEASLHPRSQRRFIQALMHIARVKNLQIIMSTHSVHVFEELPEESRVFISRVGSNVEVLQGVSPSFMHTRMDDVVHPSYYLFTEDKEATELVNGMIRELDLNHEIVQVVDIGAVNLVKNMGMLLSQNRLPYNGLGVVDGDTQATEGCISLPGGDAPERFIYSEIRNNGLHIFSQSLHVNVNQLEEVLNHAMTLDNHHNWNKYCAERLRYTASTFWSKMVICWIKNLWSHEEKERYKQIIIEKIPELGRP